MVDHTQNPIKFEGIGLCFYDLGEMRAPRRNEFFLSGAITEAWRAQSDDITVAYRIVRPTHYAQAFTGYRPGELVQFTRPGGIPYPRHMIKV